MLELWVKLHLSDHAIFANFFVGTLVHWGRFFLFVRFLCLVAFHQDHLLISAV